MEGVGEDWTTSGTAATLPQDMSAAEEAFQQHELGELDISTSTVSSASSPSLEDISGIRAMEEGDDDDDLLSSTSTTASDDDLDDYYEEREDEEFCEVNPGSRRKRPHGGSSEEVRAYAPERPPPIMDFLTVLSAFVVAVFAAYYTISM